MAIIKAARQHCHEKHFKKHPQKRLRHERVSAEHFSQYGKRFSGKNEKDEPGPL